MFFIYTILFNLDGTVTKSMYDALVDEDSEATFHSYCSTFLKNRANYRGFLVQRINENGAVLNTKNYRVPIEQPEAAE